MKWINRIVLGLLVGLLGASLLFVGTGCGSGGGGGLQLGSVWVNNQSTSTWVAYRFGQTPSTGGSDHQIMPPIMPGETDRFLIELVPGNYVITFVDDSPMAMLSTPYPLTVQAGQRVDVNIMP